MRIWIAMFTLVLAISFWRCEEQFIPETTDVVDDVVVEGYIEASDRNAPPYVILTRNFPFFSSIEQDGFDNAFIHDAMIIVSDGTQQVTLTEICLEELSDVEKQIARQQLGVNPDSIGFNFCIYTDLTFSLSGQPGKTYALEINLPDRTIKANTTIPSHVPLDSLYFTAPPGEPTDSLAELNVVINDPPNQKNFYRYQTSIGKEPLQAPIASVADDRLFDGEIFDFPLIKAEPRNVAFDVATYGLFRRGTSGELKWMCIDEAHFDFWNTLEFNAANQGPFSSYTRIASNIEGGLGIWGGISATYYTLDVPEE